MLEGVGKQKREIQFALGRDTAAKALGLIGIKGSAHLPRGESGETLWPPGVSGSISHCRTRAVAVASNSDKISGLGIDLESTSKARKLSVFSRVLSEPALAWVKSVPQDSLTRALLLFSAKESIYKAFFNAKQEKLRFEDVEFSTQLPAEVTSTTQIYQARLLRDVAQYPSGFIFSCAAYKMDEYVVTGVVL